MGLNQKIRSLHCGMAAGLNFQELDGEQVVFMSDVPFEWEDIIARWLLALPKELTNEESPDSILRRDSRKGSALTEHGWSGFISWVTQALNEAQQQPDFKAKAALGLDE